MVVSPIFMEEDLSEIEEQQEFFIVEEADEHA